VRAHDSQRGGEIGSGVNLSAAEIRILAVNGPHRAESLRDVIPLRYGKRTFVSITLIGSAPTA